MKSHDDPISMEYVIQKYFHADGFTDMDAKEIFLVQKIYKKIVNSSYNEFDIYALLMLLRQHVKNGPIREFGDFIAHREKDRG